MRRVSPVLLVLFSILTFCGTAASAEHFGADRHAAAGVKCSACHGSDAANPKMPTIETCMQCHDLKKLVAKTESVKPTNPHFSPHYQDQLDCTNCHLQHGPTENYCDQCHQFNFKVP